MFKRSHPEASKSLSLDQALKFSPVNSTWSAAFIVQNMRWLYIFCIVGLHKFANVSGFKFKEYFQDILMDFLKSLF